MFGVSGSSTLQLAGTTEKLVERLADECPYDQEYVRAFLTSYQSVMGMCTKLTPYTYARAGGVQLRALNFQHLLLPCPHHRYASHRFHYSAADAGRPLRQSPEKLVCRRSGLLCQVEEDHPA